jgi:hypothetical protein
MHSNYISELDSREPAYPTNTDCIQNIIGGRNGIEVLNERSFDPP